MTIFSFQGSSGEFCPPNSHSPGRWRHAGRHCRGNASPYDPQHRRHVHPPVLGDRDLLHHRVPLHPWDPGETVPGQGHCHRGRGAGSSGQTGWTPANNPGQLPDSGISYDTGQAFQGSRATHHQSAMKSLWDKWFPHEMFYSLNASKFIDYQIELLESIYDWILRLHNLLQMFSQDMLVYKDAI